MELHVSPPSSADGLHELVDDAPPVAPAVEPSPAAVTPANGAHAPGIPGPAADVEANADADAEEPKPTTPEAAAAAKAARARKRRRRRTLRLEAPAWAVSLIVHVVVLAVLGLATFSGEVQQAV